ENYYTSVIYTDPSLFTLGVQKGDWREYNLTKLYDPNEALHSIYQEEGQKYLVSVTNVTELYFMYKIEKKFLNGSIYGELTYNYVWRNEKPSHSHYITTTNVALLEQSLAEKRKITYQIKGQELLVQWVRNSTTYPNYYKENHSFSEEWSIDLTTGWRNSYTNILIDNGILKRHIIMEVIRGGNTNSNPRSATPISGFQILKTTVILFFVGTLAIVIKKYKH
ncbi:MAG: hypothetical protein ACFFAE_19810, partial [Candidatus Hodarchaeota archaeon]